MTEQELLDTIHESIHEANDAYCKWSGGLFLSESAVEGFMVSHMAQSIMRLKLPPAYLQLESSVQELKNESGRAHCGRPSARTSGLCRVDLAILNSSWQLKFAIEAKCTYAWSEAYDKDMERLVKMQREFGKQHKETSMQAGMFAMFVHSYSTCGYDKALKNMESRIAEWTGKLKAYQSEKNGITVSCHPSHLPYYEYDAGNNEFHLASSLVAIIKSA